MRSWDCAASVPSAPPTPPPPPLPRVPPPRPPLLYLSRSVPLRDHLRLQACRSLPVLPPRWPLWLLACLAQAQACPPSQPRLTHRLGPLLGSDLLLLELSACTFVVAFVFARVVCVVFFQ